MILLKHSSKVKSIESLRKFIENNVDWQYELSKGTKFKVPYVFFEFPSGNPIYIFKTDTHYLIKTNHLTTGLKRKLVKFTKKN